MYSSDRSLLSSIAFISHIPLPYIRQLLMQLVYILPFSSNKNPFPVNVANYSLTFFRGHPTLLYRVPFLTSNPGCHC